MAFERWRRRARALRRELYALYLAMGHDRTPIAAKALIALLVAYAVSPLDPIPDVIPVVGYLDELVVLPAGVRIALWLVPERVMEECRRRAGGELEVGRKRWIAAAGVLLVWTAVGLGVIHVFARWV